MCTAERLASSAGVSVQTAQLFIDVAADAIGHIDAAGAALVTDWLTIAPRHLMGDVIAGWAQVEDTLERRYPAGDELGRALDLAFDPEQSTLADTLIELAGSRETFEKVPMVLCEADLWGWVGHDMSLLGHGLSGSTIRRLADQFQTLARQADHWRYRRPAREHEFETWLIEHLDRLAIRGLPVRLADEQVDGIRGRQWVSDEGRDRADLICRFTEAAGDAQQDDWLIIELKMVPARTDAFDQVRRYRDALQSRGLEGELFELVIAAGITDDGEERADQLGIGFLSTSSIGFRANPSLRQIPIE